MFAQKIGNPCNVVEDGIKLCNLICEHSSLRLLLFVSNWIDMYRVLSCTSLIARMQCNYDKTSTAAELLSNVIISWFLMFLLMCYLYNVSVYCIVLCQHYKLLIMYCLLPHRAAEVMCLAPCVCYLPKFSIWAGLFVSQYVCLLVCPYFQA